MNTVVITFVICCTFTSRLQQTIASRASSVQIKSISPPNRLGEGPHWDFKTQSLYFVDIYEQKIHKYCPLTKTITSAHFNYGPVSSVVPVKDSRDKLIVASGQDVLLVTWNGHKNITDPPYEKLVSLDTGKNDTRVNDGKCDPAGRFWIGTMGNEVNGIIAPNQGSLYRFDHKKTLNSVVSPVSVSNGLAWSKNKNILYYVDSPTQQIVAFNYDIKTGDISDKRVVFDFANNNITGVPDGLTIDSNDNLWIAVHNGASVINVNPKTGTLLDTLKFPVDKITSVAFGGQHFETLYVTSAYDGLSDKERNEKPLSGCVFEVKNLSVHGVPPYEFHM